MLANSVFAQPQAGECEIILSLLNIFLKKQQIFFLPSNDSAYSMAEDAGGLIWKEEGKKKKAVELEAILRLGTLIRMRCASA